jgi:hypothetical protein
MGGFILGKTLIRTLEIEIKSGLEGDKNFNSTKLKVRMLSLA